MNKKIFALTLITILMLSSISVNAVDALDIDETVKDSDPDKDPGHIRVRRKDTDNDGRLEFAIDQDHIEINGYELYVDRDGTSQALISIDGDIDLKIDHFIDITLSGFPDVYWDPDTELLVNIKLIDVDYDKTVEWVYDSDGDGVDDRYYDPDDGTIYPYIIYRIELKIVGNGNVIFDPYQPYYLPNTKVRIQAVPIVGWEFDHWEGDLSGNINPETLIMDSDKGVVAYFTEIVAEYTLTINILGSGTVIKTPDQTTYNFGDLVNIEAFPNLGWSFSSWSGDHFGNTNPDTITITDNMVINAIFRQDRYYLTTSMSGSGLGSLEFVPVGPYYFGDVVTFWANASVGSSFVGWSGDLGGSSSPEILVMDRDRLVDAEFVLDGPFTITINTLGSGTITKNPEKEFYYYGEAIDIEAFPSAGWTFASWSVDHSGTNNPDTITISNNMIINATFTENPIYYNLTISIDGNGTTIPIIGNHSYLNNSNISIEAIADPGWSFDQWSGNLSGITNLTSITMDSNKTITAHFTKDPVYYDLSIIVEGNGSTDPVAGVYSYLAGSIVQVNASADCGWVFDHWSGNLSGSNNQSSIVMDSNKSVIAHFVEDLIYYNLEILIFGNGSTTPTTGNHSYLAGTNVTLNAVADPGKMFVCWLGHINSTNSSINILMDSNKILFAVFMNITINYTLNINIVGKGTVEKFPDLPHYPSNTTLVINAIPDEGWNFSHWSGDGINGSIIPFAFILMNSNKSITANFVPIPDLIKPSNVTGLNVTDKKDGELYLSWNNASDNVGIDHYEIWRNDALVGNATDNFYADVGLEVGIVYSYQIRAVDYYGNVGNFSEMVNGSSTASDTGDDDDDDDDSTTGNPGVPYVPGIPVIPAKSNLVADAGGPYIGHPDERIEFDGSNSNNSDGNITGYRWDFDGNGEFDTNWSDNPIYNYSYSLAGEYILTLEIKDNDNNTATNETTVSIVIPNRPPINLTVNGTLVGKNNTDYIYTVNATDPDAPYDMLRYIFNWSDGTNDTISDFVSSGILVNATHNWSLDGKYVVTIYVEDIDGARVVETIDVVIGDSNTGDIIDPVEQKISSNNKGKSIPVPFIIGFFVLLLILLLFIFFLYMHKNKQKNPRNIAAKDVMIKNIVITGHTDQVGSELAKHLSQRFKVVELNKKKDKINQTVETATIEDSKVEETVENIKKPKPKKTAKKSTTKKKTTKTSKKKEFAVKKTNKKK